MITYRPGSKNLKPDALSRQLVSEEVPPTEDTIILSTFVVAAISWEIESAVREAQRSQPDPGNRPQNRLYVPDSVHSQVLQWVHSSKFSCYPGMSRTLSLLKRHFWWPSMEAYTLPLSPPARYVLEGNPLTVLLLPAPTSACPRSPLVPHCICLCDECPALQR